MDSYRIAIVIIALSLGYVPAALADTVVEKALLTGAVVVPANAGTATGESTFTFNTATHQLRYFVSYDGLTGTATLVDLHGPASTDATAAVAVSFPVADSPVEGQATLTDDQASAFLAGRLYVDVHTGKYPAGEIRGQIVK